MKLFAGQIRLLQRTISRIDKTHPEPIILVEILSTDRRVLDSAEVAIAKRSSMRARVFGGEMSDVSLMRLYWSSRSPFVRKAMVVAHETGIISRIETVRVEVAAAKLNAEVMAQNPLNRPYMPMSAERAEQG